MAPNSAVLTRTYMHVFTGTHMIEGLPKWHPCSRVHGLTCHVTLELEGTAEEVLSQSVPMLGDPEVLREYEQWFEATFTGLHGYPTTLNTVIGGPGDMESLSGWVWEQWHERVPELVAVAAVEGLTWNGGIGKYQPHTGSHPQQASMTVAGLHRSWHDRNQPGAQHQ